MESVFMKTWKNKYQEIFRKNFFEFSFKIFHELMANKVKEILLVSSPYDAFILEEDGRFAERIIHEYRGLNLTHPPKLTWASSPEEAFEFLSKKSFDLIITMPRFDDINPYKFCSDIKGKHPKIPVYLLAHTSSFKLLIKAGSKDKDKFDKKFVWSGNADLLLAIVKSVEDLMNVPYDTKRAKVRVLILVEDSPKYLSSLLPLLYKEVVLQTQAVMEDSLNEEDRLLRMRARPKILLAENYDDAIALFNKYKPFLLGIISDIRFKKAGKINGEAGFLLHDYIKKESPDTPILLLSSEDENKIKATRQSALFFNKNSSNLHAGIHSFLVDNLAFGSFIFTYPSGNRIAKASNLREMEKLIPTIPDESIEYHTGRNHISAWLTARSEIFLASLIRPLHTTSFSSTEEFKHFIAFCINQRRKGQQRGVIADYHPETFDPETIFLKIGTGSLGGKARGLAFATTLLDNNPQFRDKFPNLNIRIPKTLVISTEYFDQFMDSNELRPLISKNLTNDELVTKFVNAKIPNDLKNYLENYLLQVKHPLAVRSSSLLEDSLYQPSAGLYETFFIPNNNPDFQTRLKNLIKTVKEVFASTYFEAAKLLSKTTLHRTEEEKMAVIIEEAIGQQYGDYFFPAISGVAQSYNYYTMSYMKPEEGIAHIALGFGKTVVEGGQVLRFSPKYPQLLPHFSKIEDILKTAQQTFFALNMKNPQMHIIHQKNYTDISEFKLSKLEVDEYQNTINNFGELRELFSSYIASDHKIVDYFSPKQHSILTFSNILKYKSFPLPEILNEILLIGRKGMGAPVEIEFAVNYQLEKSPPDVKKPEFILLQIRPMTIQTFNNNVTISKKEKENALCYSSLSMGNGIISNIYDIIIVNENTFDPAQTISIANDISILNKKLMSKNRKYLLIGPGRWGSTDRWLGIPVGWSDICGIKAIVETTIDSLKASPSQGSHFFHNLCSMGIPYLTIPHNTDSFLNKKKLNNFSAKEETKYLKHIQLQNPLFIKANGRLANAAILEDSNVREKCKKSKI
jgi:hypothetical protein